MLAMDAVTLMTCVLLVVYDGDTVKCDGENLRLLGDGAPFVSGVDTPEIGRWARCETEHRLGKAAAARLQELIAQPGLQIENSKVRDHLGRRLVTLRLADGRTAGSILIDEGHAVVWRPNKKKHDWCSDK
jgi:micrococcal nuclease